MVECNCQLCPHDPKLLLGYPVGMYHCPVCSEIVLAGFDHPFHSFDCPNYIQEDKEDKDDG